MKQNILQFAKLLGFVAFIVLCFMFSPIVVPFLIGGVIKSGILGGFSGKVGPVVGGKWKDIDYMRSYVIPQNPNTAGQQAQRTRFVIIQELARQVLATLIQPYWDMYESSQSGYNAVMQNWLLNANGTDKLVVACKASKGTLAIQAIDSATYDTSDGATEVTWTNSPVGNQLGTDLARILVYDNVGQLLYFTEGTTARSIGSKSVALPSGLTAANVIIFLFFSQGTGSSMIVSDSAAQVCVGP